MNHQMAFFFDASGCSGCKTCQIACKDKNNLPLGVRFRRVYEVSGGDWKRNGNAWQSNIVSWNVSLACNHCQEPICLKSCPNKAISKNESGLVILDQNRCMGCRYCEWTCPYGALQFNEALNVMSKCDFCSDYLEKGEKPACVSACPMRVLDYGELDELRLKYGEPCDIFPLPDSEITQPALVLKPHPDAKKSDLAGLRLGNTEEVKN